MSVKRFDLFGLGGGQYDIREFSSGGYVRHEDYAALEARCAALAAEVYDLKHPGTYLPSKRDTPATDIFLAEVRHSAIKSALDDCLEYLDRDCIMESNGISYEDAALREAGAMALCNALLRKGVQL